MVVFTKCRIPRAICLASLLEICRCKSSLERMIAATRETKLWSCRLIALALLRYNLTHPAYDAANLPAAEPPPLSRFSVCPHNPPSSVRVWKQDRSCCYVLPARCFARALPEFHLLCASGAVGEDRRALEDALAELSAVSDLVLIHSSTHGGGSVKNRELPGC